MRYDKLVRDKIPEIIKGKGEDFTAHVAERGEYEKKLKEKLLEEVNEFMEAGTINEVADILEVIDAICEQMNFDRKEVERIKEEKALKKGKFKNKIILEES